MRRSAPAWFCQRHRAVRAMFQPRFRGLVYLPFLKDVVAARHQFCEAGPSFFLLRGLTEMSPDTLNSLFSLCIGFAFAGALTSGFQVVVQRPAGFRLLQEGVAPSTFAAVPF